MAISPFGLQLLNEPGIFEILWKNTREAAWHAAGVPLARDGVIVDESGNGRDLTADASCQVTNGVLGVAGWDDVAPADLQFARRFHNGATNLVAGPVIDPAIPISCSQEHTIQVLVKVEWDDFVGTNRGIHATALNNPASGVGTDYINRISVSTNARFVHFTENNDVNVDIFTAPNAVRAGFWQLITLVHRVQNATNFNTSFFVHTRELNGTVTGGLDSIQSTLRCALTSGLTSSRTAFGRFDLNATGTTLIGDVGLARVVTSALSDTDVENQAQEILTTGALADWGAAELYRYRLREVPDLVDEGPLGVHLAGLGDYDVGGDFLGTGGRSYRVSAADRVVSRQFQAPVSLANIVGGPSTRYRIVDLFNDTAAAGIPVWNLLVWGTTLASTTARLVWFESTSGESLNTNVFQTFLSGGNIGFFAERGNGSNINGKTAVGAFPTDGRTIAPMRLWGFRYKEDPGAPNDPLYRGSFDDQIDILTRGINDQFQGGISHVGWEFDWTTEGLLQETHFVWGRELTDAEIQAAFANTSTPGGPSDTTPPTIEVVSPPPGTALDASGNVVVRVLDDVAIGFAELSVRYSGSSSEIIARDDSFRFPYVGTRTPIAGGFEYSVSRAGGWPTGNPLFEAITIDTGGNRS